MRALVVDDDPIDCQIAREVLAARKFDVAVASRAATLKSFDVHSVDLVFCDLSMPDFDGIEYFELLRQRMFSGGLIIASAASETILRSACALARAYGLVLLGTIDKPLTVEKLDSVLRQAIENTGTVY